MEIKSRKSFYCNLKLVLIYLVVYGHLIEDKINESHILLVQYKLIYTVHMPLFAFLSGIFMKKEQECLKQAKHTFMIYLISQFTVFAMTLLSGQSFNILIPYWHLWYLLSLSIWAAAASIWYKLKRYFPIIENCLCKIIIMLLFIFIGIAAGNCKYIGRVMSLSRTIVFFPYFLLGVFLKKELFLKRYHIAKTAGMLVFALIVICCLDKIITELKIPVEFLYHAEGYYYYKNLEIYCYGEILRFFCYIMGFFMGISLLIIIPDKRLSFTRIGVDTIWIYLLHAPIVKAVNMLPFSASQIEKLAPIFSFYIVYILYKMFQLKMPLYSIEKFNS